MLSDNLILYLHYNQNSKHLTQHEADKNIHVSYSHLSNRNESMASYVELQTYYRYFIIRVSMPPCLSFFTLTQRLSDKRSLVPEYRNACTRILITCLHL